MTTQTTDLLALLKNMYAAEAEYLAAGGPGEASFELLAPFFAPDVVLHQAEALPYGGTWRGHDGMERFFLAMSQAWQVFDMVDQKFLATEGTAVVLTQVHACARATGRTLDFPSSRRSGQGMGASARFARSIGTPPRSPTRARSRHRSRSASSMRPGRQRIHGSPGCLADQRLLTDTSRVPLEYFSPGGLLDGERADGYYCSAVLAIPRS